VIATLRSGGAAAVSVDVEVPGTLSGKIAIVTGASSGFGVEFARALSDEGATVICVARRSARLEQLEKDTKNIVPWPCDITDATQCAALVEGCLTRFGHIDILVNNAGASNIIAAELETPEAFRELLELNLVAPFRLAHLVAPSMIERSSGSIINVASIVGLVGLGRMPQAGYAASKGGLVNLTRELAAQWARRGIRVNALAPGFFPTEMTAELFDSERGQDWVSRLTPMGRGGQLSELRGALLYLAGSASSYTTGIILPIDGGWTAV
jgi:NAD(P)-dependent dehydrogenase (short-subunit alcohol dehydrogenase family)